MFLLQASLSSQLYCISSINEIWHDNIYVRVFFLVQRNSPLFDEEELQSDAVQRVWQYLQLYNEDPRLVQEFSFDPQSKRDDSPEECLETLIRFVIYNVQQLPCLAYDPTMISERRKHSTIYTCLKCTCLWSRFYKLVGRMNQFTAYNSYHAGLFQLFLHYETWL